MRRSALRKKSKKSWGGMRRNNSWKKISRVIPRRCDSLEVCSNEGRRASRARKADVKSSNPGRVGTGGIRGKMKNTKT